MSTKLVVPLQSRIDSEFAAWFAGMMVTDGSYIANSNGWSGLAQSRRDVDFMGRVADQLGRPLFDGPRSGFTGEKGVLVTFKAQPKEWKLTVPSFSFLSDLERHYWRGCLDGDGCIQILRDGRMVVWMCVVDYQSWLADAYRNFLDRLGVVHHTYLQGRVAKIHVGQQKYTRPLAEFLYEGAEWALPFKKNRALQPRYRAA